MDHQNSRKQERKRKRIEKKSKRNDLYQNYRLLSKKNKKFKAKMKYENNKNIFTDKNEKKQRLLPPTDIIKTKIHNDQEIKISTISKKGNQGSYFKSQINRASISNLNILIGNIYESLANFNEQGLSPDPLVSALLEAIDQNIVLLDLHIMVHAALLTSLTHLIGSDLFNLLLKAILLKLKFDHLQLGMRRTLNLVTFIAYLFEFQILGSNLIIELILFCLENFREESAEIILRLLRISVPQFRRSEPDSLSQLANMLLEKLNDNHSINSRFKFIIESIKDIKNNIFRLKNMYQKDIDNLKVTINNVIHQNVMMKKMDPINSSIETFLSYNFKTAKSNIIVSNQQEKDSSLEEHSDSVKMGNLKIKDEIINTIFDSSDYIDAFQRLVDLKLNNNQERQIVLVLMNCVSNERLYNPFYAFLTEKLIEYKHNFRITVKYFLKDFLKEGIDVSSCQRIHHIGKFYHYLFQKGRLNIKDLPLSILSELSEMAQKFISINFNDLPV